MLDRPTYLAADAQSRSDDAPGFRRAETEDRTGAPFDRYRRDGRRCGEKRVAVDVTLLEHDVPCVVRVVADEAPTEVVDGVPELPATRE